MQKVGLGVIVCLFLLSVSKSFAESGCKAEVIYKKTFSGCNRIVDGKSSYVAANMMGEEDCKLSCDFYGLDKACTTILKYVEDGTRGKYFGCRVSGTEVKNQMHLPSGVTKYGCSQFCKDGRTKLWKGKNGTVHRDAMNELIRKTNNRPTNNLGRLPSTF